MSWDEDRDWRHAVHEVLAQLLLDDDLVEDMLTVQGNVGVRVARVMTRVRELGGLVPPGGEA